MNKEFKANLSQLKQVAFTLAETLIVMGIIGVVAALTLPNLNSSTGEKEKVAKLQKIYSNLQDAFGRAEAVYGPYDEWFVNDGDDYGKKAKRVFERITEFMKYSKVCTVNDACTLFNAGSSEGTRTQYSVILADGSIIGFSWDANNNGKIYVDIDGMNKGPNYAGKDYFNFTINNEDKLHLNKYYNDNPEQIYYDDASSTASWVIKFGNMDYLKLKDGKCPNGTKLSATQTSCK